MDLIELIKEIIAICVGLAAIAGGVAVILKMLSAYGKQHDFMQKCEGYEERINKLEEKFNEKFKESDMKLEGIQSETDAKLQEIRAEQCMMTYCMRAVLDGLHQLNCNGPVTEASEKLDKYLNQQAHGLKD